VAGPVAYCRLRRLWRLGLGGRTSPINRMGPSVEDGWRESSRRRRTAGANRAGQSSSAHRLITAPHIQVIPDTAAVETAVHVAAVTTGMLALPPPWPRVA
jgi:hypothetical protein